MVALLLNALFAAAALGAIAALVQASREASRQMRSLYAELAGGIDPVVVSVTIRSTSAQMDNRPSLVAPQPQAATRSVKAARPRRYRSVQPAARAA